MIFKQNAEKIAIDFAPFLGYNNFHPIKQQHRRRPPLTASDRERGPPTESPPRKDEEAQHF